MHAVIVGGGVAGLGTALSLSRRGHRVTVLERDDTPMPDSPRGIRMGSAGRAAGPALTCAVGSTPQPAAR